MTSGARAAGRRTDGPPRAGQRPRGDLAARRDRLREVIEPVVLAAGCDLEDLTVSRAGRRHLVRVLIDADGGVTLDAVAEVSRAVSAALDEAEEAGTDLIAGEYQLEVSSPGVDRPLTLPRHWRRNMGRLVKVTVAQRPVTGRVVAADDERVVLDVDGQLGEWPYTELGPGRVQVEFNRLDEELDDTGDIDDDQEEAVIR
ncbi:MAG TPA: ribosome maturation factor RimP [Micromonosporaceae bacterium]|nr:ribosome maturation factor RimP [Micromonosporaceae bacterium]